MQQGIAELKIWQQQKMFLPNYTYPDPLLKKERKRFPLLSKEGIKGRF